MSSKRNPWMKFYPSDWRADQALRVCSLAARGLWIECMCIMHQAEPYGHLVVNGSPVTTDQLALLTGVSPDQIAELLTELEMSGVMSRTRAGVVFSRRMTRDHRRTATGRKHAKKRWERGISGKPQPVEIKEKKPPPNGSPNGSPNAKKPEARYTVSNDTDASKPASDPKADLFNGVSAWLGKLYGKPPNSYRSVIGKWLKALDDDVDELLAICRTARDDGIADPLAWISKSCQPKAKHGMVPISEITNTLIERNKRFDA